MFQIRRIGFRIISLSLVSHDLHFPARTGGNRRDNRIQFIHLMQFVASHPYTPHFSFRLPQHILRGTVKRNFSLIHKRHTVACTRYIAHDMGGKDNCHVVFADFRQEIAKTNPLLRIEPRRGFVYNNHFRVMNQCLRNPQTALHTSRQLIGIPVAYIEKSDILQHLVHCIFPQRLTVHTGKTRSII